MNRGNPWSDFVNERDRNAWSYFDNYPGPEPWVQSGPGTGPSFGRNEHYRNAYPNYEGGYSGNGRREIRPQNHPDYFLQQGFGSAGGPYMRRKGIQEHAGRFLLSCGMNKNIVQNLPIAFLALVEPDHCRLCAMSFDNFNVAGLHYVSKNHMKKQKKWLDEFNDDDSMHRANSGQLAPMKARELYCELCDVQITSKTHAASHYSGKPHRAIVEGRKVPKNPFLNQYGMEKRLEQLIRREKRKLSEEPGAEGAGAAKRANNATSSELYCDICKVTVTCLEQMTSHMNGKKHLSKEKQYILDTMNGTNEPGACNDEEEDNNLVPAYNSQESENSLSQDETNIADASALSESRSAEQVAANEPVVPESAEDWKDGSQWET